MKGNELFEISNQEKKEYEKKFEIILRQAESEFKAADNDSERKNALSKLTAIKVKINSLKQIRPVK